MSAITTRRESAATVRSGDSVISRRFASSRRTLLTASSGASLNSSRSSRGTSCSVAPAAGRDRWRCACALATVGTDRRTSAAQDRARSLIGEEYPPVRSPSRPLLLPFVGHSTTPVSCWRQVALPRVRYRERRRRGAGAAPARTFLMPTSTFKLLVLSTTLSAGAALRVDAQNPAPAGLRCDGLR